MPRGVTPCHDQFSCTHCFQTLKLEGWSVPLKRNLVTFV
jgi:hypothetical protein